MTKKKKKRTFLRKITVKIEESLQVLIRRLKSISDILCLVTKKVTSCDKEAIRLLLYFRKFVCDIGVGKLNIKKKGYEKEIHFLIMLLIKEPESILVICTIL